MQFYGIFKIYFRIDDLLNFADAAFGEITEERWRRACDHVERVIEKSKAYDWYRDHHDME
jgi:hypothetical protein